MRKALTDNKYSLIKAHVLDPENSPLTAEHQEILDRVLSISKILDKNPLQKHAVAIHRAKYPHIGKTQAYEDMRLAIKLFNTFHTFDYDFYQTWMINDIIQNIENARKGNSHQDRRVIAMEHANLIKAIGKRPDEIPDPKRNEKHQFYFVININNEMVQVDLNNLKKLPAETLNALNKALFSGKEITDVEAEEIMNS
jgi:hypothetical protein